MKTILLLVFQFAGPVSIGLTVTYYLRAATVRLLTDLCGTPDRAEFWGRISAVLMVLMPLALVLSATMSPLRCLPDDAICADLVFRQTCRFTLVGLLLSVGAVACVIAQYLPRARKYADAAEEAV
jgi:hypothetical protein